MSVHRPASLHETPDADATALRWRPVFDRAIPRAPVAADARRIDVRVLDHQDLAHVMRAAPDEARAIVDMLGLLECTYGAPALQRALPAVLAALATGVLCLGRSLGALAAQRGFAQASLFVGALLESALSEAHTVPARDASRCVPQRLPAARSSSPHLEFDDLLLGAQLCTRLCTDLNAQRSLPDETRVRAYGLMVCALRQHLGNAAGPRLLALATRAVIATDRAVGFATAVDALATANAVTMPAAWRRYRGTLATPSASASAQPVQGET